MYQNDGKKKVWKGLEQLMLQSIHHLWNMVEQCDGMSLGYWCSEDRSSRMNSEVHMDILYAQIQSNTAKMIERRLVQMDDDPKHTAKTTQEFLSDLNLIEHAFHLLKTKLKAERATKRVSFSVLKLGWDAKHKLAVQ